MKKVDKLKDEVIQAFNTIKQAFDEMAETVAKFFAELRAFSEDVKIPTKQKHRPVKCIGSTKSAVLPCKRQYKARSCC